MTNFLEQQVEALIVAALQTAVGTDATVLGFVQPAAAGTEKKQPASCILVTVRPRACASQNSNVVALSVMVNVKVSASESPDGDKLPDLAAAVMSTLHGWNRDLSAMNAALSVSNVFSADGFVFTDGGDADFDPELFVWYYLIPLQIKGTVQS